MALAAGTYAVLSTTEGKITVRLFEAEAPITVKNFIELAEGAKEWTHPTSRAKSSDRVSGMRSEVTCSSMFTRSRCSITSRNVVRPRTM